MVGNETDREGRNKFGFIFYCINWTGGDATLEIEGERVRRWGGRGWSRAGITALDACVQQQVKVWDTCWFVTRGVRQGLHDAFICHINKQQFRFFLFLFKKKQRPQIKSLRCTQWRRKKYIFIIARVYNSMQQFLCRTCVLFFLVYFSTAMHLTK